MLGSSLLELSTESSIPTHTKYICLTTLLENNHQGDTISCDIYKWIIIPQVCSERDMV
jgi:hypothetical protein